LGYWVYLPPAASLEDAQEVGRRLAGKGVTDYVFVVGIEKANAISLGLYPDQETAQLRVAHLQTLGFEPKLERRYSRTAAVTIILQTEAEEPPPVSLTERWQSIVCKA
jgi:hypothetical protein